MVILKVGIGLFSERLFLVCFDFFLLLIFFFLNVAKVSHCFVVAFS